MKDRIVRLVGNHAMRHGLLSRPLFILAQVYRDRYLAAHSYEMAQNGENGMLRVLRGLDVRTVFDVGAHEGEWAANAMAAFPRARVHCFELSGDTASRLAKRFSAAANVVVNPIGLSNTDGDVSYYSVTANSSLTTIVPSLGKHATLFVGRVMRADTYARSEGLSSVDLVKVDVEGHELSVIKGLGGLKDRITVLQFEYNEMSWRCGNFLEAFQAELPQFTIGRLTGGGVMWDRSLSSNDHLTAGNMVAVHASRPDVRHRLMRFSV
jgi:FkbM family methyltransferase